MKKQYEKPTFVVENYTLTQSIASCSGLQLGFTSSDCVLNDSKASSVMKDWAQVGGFIASNSTDSCLMDLSGYTEGSVDDMMCYFTSINSAFTS